MLATDPKTGRSAAYAFDTVFWSHDAQTGAARAEGCVAWRRAA